MGLGGFELPTIPAEELSLENLRLRLADYNKSEFLLTEVDEAEVAKIKNLIAKKTD